MTDETIHRKCRACVSCEVAVEGDICGLCRTKLEKAHMKNENIEMARMVVASACVVLLAVLVVRYLVRVWP